MKPGELLRDSDRQAGALLVERIGKLNQDRCAQGAIGNHRAAVRDAGLIHDLLNTATVEQLRAALLQVTTPELTYVPVAVGGAT